MEIYDSPTKECFAYWGEHGDWLSVIARTRDSGCLEESNYSTALKMLREVAEENEDFYEEHASHWLCGWVDTIVVKPGSEAETMAEEILARTEDYPVLDEDDWTEREHEVVLVGLTEAIDHHYRRHPFISLVSPGPVIEDHECITGVAYTSTQEIASWFYHFSDGDWYEQRCYPDFTKGDDTGDDNRYVLAKALREWRKGRK